MLRTVRRAVTPTTYHSAQCRGALFNLRKFTSTNPISHIGSETQSYHERKIFPYRRSELYRIISDVESYPEFVPYCTGSRILENRMSQDGTTIMDAELTIGFLAFKESYISTVICKPHESVEAVASSSSPLFKTLSTTWRLQPVTSPSRQLTVPLQEIPARDSDSRTFANDGSTLVTLDLAFAFANPMHATISATFFGKVSKLMVKAFEQRCIAQCGPRTD